MTRTLVSLLAVLLAIGGVLAAPRLRSHPTPVRPHPRLTAPAHGTHTTKALAPPVGVTRAVAGLTTVVIPGYSNVQVGTTYVHYFTAQPSLLRNNGVKVIKASGGNQVILAVGSAPVQGSSAKAEEEALAQARRSALRALEAELQSGAHVFRADQVGGGTVVRPVSAKGKGPGATEATGLSPAALEQLLAHASVVATWTSNNGKVLHVALGVLVDSHGHPVSVEKIVAEAQKVLKPFITAGHWQPGHGYQNEAAPISYSALLSAGALRPNDAGLQMLLNFGNNPYHLRPHDENRPRWHFSSQNLHKLTKAELAELKEAQALIRDHGPELVELGLLSK